MLQKEIHERFRNFGELLIIIDFFRTLSTLKNEAFFPNTGVQIFHLPVRTEFAYYKRTCNKRVDILGTLTSVIQKGRE
jgi:hypothetical protein